MDLKLSSSMVPLYSVSLKLFSLFLCTGLLVFLAMSVYTGVTMNYYGKRYGNWRFSWSYIIGWVSVVLTFFSGKYAAQKTCVCIESAFGFQSSSVKFLHFQRFHWWCVHFQLNDIKLWSFTNKVTSFKAILLRKLLSKHDCTQSSEALPGEADQAGNTLKILYRCLIPFTLYHVGICQSFNKADYLLPHIGVN